MQICMMKEKKNSGRGYGDACPYTLGGLNLIRYSLEKAEQALCEGFGWCSPECQGDDNV